MKEVRRGGQGADDDEEAVDEISIELDVEEEEEEVNEDVVG